MPVNTESGLDRLQATVHTALRTWNSLHINGLERFNQLQLLRLKGIHRDDVEPARKRALVNALLDECIDQLHGSQPLEAEVLHRRFVLGDIIIKAADELNISQDQLNRLQRRALENLTRLLVGRETALRARRAGEMQAQLPPVQFLSEEGLGPAESALLQWAQSAGPPGALGLYGLGGSGKTQLAAALAHRLAPDYRFDHILWIDLEAQAIGTPLAALAGHLLPQPLPPSDRWPSRLRSLLRHQSHLIVVDNAHAAMINRRAWSALLPLLDPSKLILIGAQRPPPIPGIRAFPLGEWDQVSARRLVVQHAHMAGLPDPEHSVDDYHQHLCGVTGRHPAAIQLAASMLAALPPQAVARNFLHAGDGQVLALYRRAFGYAWPRLSSAAQDLLKVLAREEQVDFSLKQIRDLGGLAEVDTHACVRELHAHALLQRVADPGQPRYRLARLTCSFLRSEYVDLI